MLKPKQGGLASCPPDYLKHEISRLRLNTTAFPSRYLGRHTRRTATSPISTNCPSKTNTRRPRRSCVMPRALKAIHLLGLTAVCRITPEKQLSKVLRVGDALTNFVRLIGFDGISQQILKLCST